MGSVTIWSERHIDASPSSLFATLANGPQGGWLFKGTCDTVEQGAVITLHLPIDGDEHQPIELLGRVRNVTPPVRIEIVHHQPWEGRLVIRLDADNRGGTRVRLIGEVDEQSLEWLMRRRGHHVADNDASYFRVGLLTSKTGPASVFAEATEYAARMAVDEINDAGGIRDQPVGLLVGDDATEPAVGVSEARRLVQAGCRVILATTTSATFAQAAHHLRGSGVPLVHTPMNEGGVSDEHCIRLGERPAEQLLAACPTMEQTGSRRWYLAGNDYVWPRAVHYAARAVLPANSGRIVGEAYAPLGTRDFSAIIDKIQASKADTILSTFVGADLVAFERQCFEAGLRTRTRSLAPALDEPTRERIGDSAAIGTIGVARYFPEAQGAANADFAARYNSLYGDFAPALSSISQSVYDALHLVTCAANRQPPDEPAVLSSSIHQELNRRRASNSGHTSRQRISGDLYVATSVTGGFDLARAPVAI